MSKIAEQITAFEQKRASLIAANDAIMTKAAEDGTTLDASQKETFDGNEADIGEIDDHLKRLRSMEKATASTARPIDGLNLKSGSESRSGELAAPIVIKGEKDEAFKGQNYTRMVIAKTLARLEGVSAEGIAFQRWGKSNPTLVKVIKAAVAGGGTEAGEWGAELAQADTRYTGDFIDFLYAQTIFDRLPLREVPANVHIKGQDGAATAYWVGQSKSIPVTKADFSDVQLSALKVAAIAVISKELLRDSSPSAELLVRDALVQASAQRVDQTFLSDAAAVANVSPAGILNGLTALVSSGNDVADVITDVKALYAPFITANNADGLQFVTTTSLAKSLGLIQNVMGNWAFPGWLDVGNIALRGKVLPASLDLQMVPSHAQARRLGKIHTVKSNPEWAGQVATNFYGLNALGEETATLKFGPLGIDQSFSVQSVRIADDIIGAQVAASSLGPSAYAWDAALEEGQGPSDPPDTSTPVDLSPPNDIAAGTEQVVIDGATVGVRIVVGWTMPPRPALRQRAQFRESPDGTWQDMQTADGGGFAMSGAVNDGGTYNYRVQTVRPVR